VGRSPTPYGSATTAKSRPIVAWRKYTLITYPHTHTRPFNGPFSRTTRVGRYQKSKTNPDFTEARDSEWQWYQLGRTQVCTSLQTDNHASTSPLSFLLAGCPSCRPTNSVKALKAHTQCCLIRRTKCLHAYHDLQLAVSAGKRHQMKSTK